MYEDIELSFEDEDTGLDVNVIFDFAVYGGTDIEITNIRCDTEGFEITENDLALFAADMLEEERI